ncbi:signal recognition particle-docking protein FtsY [Metaclostridioides mangenotii]|uniref:signal recognition particle-docking protein FtsY n=1 Tax=Metaclostridioides mangenotii TaxID=1540 RepID=UPI00048933DA|nr:signal recognition particle-docking protein FtsY [Clostridioides mangenotii]
MFKKFFKSKKQEANQDEVKDIEQVSEEADESQEVNKSEEISESRQALKAIEEVTLEEGDIKETDIKDTDINDTNNDDKEIDNKEVKDGEVSEEVEKSEKTDESVAFIEVAEIAESEEVDSEVLQEELDSIQDDIQEEALEEDSAEENLNMFERLKQGLTKAKQGITDKIDTILKSYTKVDEELLEDLEEILITSDVGVNTTMDIIDSLRSRIKEKGITDPMDVRIELKSIVEEILTEENTKLDINPSPCIILMVGVNGVGKTTTIGKLATRYKKEGKKVLLAAADTFRAAATEQLDIWAKRANVDIIKHNEGADPGAVVFDAVKAARARGVDVLICDTAGRLHNKTNLMNELGKIFKIVDREFPEAKREVLLVVDATTGQNAVSQAKTFKEVADITGIVLTKLDGTAKGGVVIAVKSEVDVPVRLIGVGEKAEDLQDFDAKLFSEALFGN